MPKFVPVSKRIKKLLERLEWLGTMHSQEDPGGAELKPVDPIRPPIPKDDDE